MKKKSTALGLVIPGKMRIAGMIFYKQGGQVVGRVSESNEKRSNTLGQFRQRQKMRHTTMLWKMLRFCDSAVHHRGGPASRCEELRRTDRAAVPVAEVKCENEVLDTVYGSNRKSVSRFAVYLPTLSGATSNCYSLKSFSSVYILVMKITIALLVLNGLQEGTVSEKDGNTVR